MQSHMKITEPLRLCTHELLHMDLLHDMICASVSAFMMRQQSLNHLIEAPCSVAVLAGPLRCIADAPSQKYIFSVHQGPQVLNVLPWSAEQGFAVLQDKRIDSFC